MAFRTWTRDEIRAFVAGSEVQFLSPAAHMLTVPDWAMEASEGPWVVSTLAGFESAHPEDHQKLLAWWVKVTERPAVVVEAPIRFLHEDIWIIRRLRGLNLSDQPDVRAVVACATYAGLASGTKLDAAPPRSRRPEASVDWIIAHLDRVGHIVQIEGRVRELVGRDVAEMIGRSTVDFMRPEDATSVVPYWLALLEKPGATASSRRCFVHPDGSEIWAECTYMNRFDATGAGDVLMVAYDISARREQERALRESNDEIRRLGEEAERLADESQMLARHFRLLADQVPAAVFRCDSAGRLIFGNGQWSESFPHHVDGDCVQKVVIADDRALLDDLLAGLALEGKSEIGVVEVRATDGQRVLRVRCRSIWDGATKQHRFVGSIDDISATVQLRNEARRDALTGLLNRAAFEEDVARRLAADPTGTLLVFVDLDGFKRVNDDHGHDAGDVVLVEVARRLAEGIRPQDSVGRYGGDEFVIACGGAHGGAEAIADRLTLALGGPIGFAGGWWTPSASTGTAQGEPGDAPADLLHRADIAMFDVKRTRSTSRVTR